MKHKKRQQSMPFRFLAWLLILSQALSSAAFADVLAFSKDTVAVPSVFESSSPSERSEEFKNSVLSDMQFLSVAFSVAAHFLVDGGKAETLPKTIRDEFRNDKRFLNDIDRHIDIDHARLEGDIVILPFEKDKVRYLAKICAKDKLPSIDKTGSEWATSGRFGIQIVPETPAQPVSQAAALSAPSQAIEPLIGHGFTDAEADKAPITIWSKSEAFSKMLTELEETIKARAPNAMKAKLLDTLNAFKAGKDGRRLGTTPSRYDSSEKYYLGFGTAKSKALATRFFDPTSPLYHFSQEALFHELFHSAFGRADEYVGPHDTATHFQAIQIQAVIFWGLGEDEVKGLTMEGLEKHPANKLGENIRSWKRFKQAEAGKVDVPKAMATEDWKYLLTELRAALKVGWESNRNISGFLAACDEAATRIPRHPVEARYPILKAVTKLSRNDKETLKIILAGQDCDSIRDLPVVDSILLMLTKKVPDNWLSKQAPELKDRSVWIMSSEIWSAGGGLGRVEQSHCIGFQELLRREGRPLKTVEPYYGVTTNKKTKKNEPVDYAKLLGVKAEDIKKEVERFEFSVGPCVAVAVCYMAVNKFGIESYLIKGYQKGQKESEVPYYTERLYSYRDESGPLSVVTLDEFSAFFSRASLELARLVEDKERLISGEDYNEPVMHFQDGQLGFAPLFRSIYYNDDPVLGNATIAYSSHTYPNRCHKDKIAGEKALSYLNVPQEYWKYFYRHFGTIVDQTSAGARTADWYAGVSKKHVDDILGYIYDNWGEWTYLDGSVASDTKNAMVSVTNGDVRAITAGRFREIMLNIFPDADVENPTPVEALTTKRAAKGRLGLITDQPVVSFTGRVVKEKAGRVVIKDKESQGRAFCPRNIEEMVKAGIQVVIGANIAGNPELVKDFEYQAADIARKKFAHPDIYKGNFILMSDCDQDDQRAILAATDIQVQDSDPNTEAAGYSESNIGVCAGLQLAPPWPEGILQAQGIRFNPDVPGEGNTIVPKDGSPEAYLAAIKTALEKTPEELAEYQANAVPLSGILEYLLTSAEYFRQWNAAVIKKESASAGSASTSVDNETHSTDIKGDEADDSNELIYQLIKDSRGGKQNIVEIALEGDGLEAHIVKYVDGYTPGTAITDPKQYRGDPYAISEIFTPDEEARFLEYMRAHREISGKPVKFRVAIGRTTLGWAGDAEHISVAHAGVRDGVVYIGMNLLKALFQPGEENERLREEVLERDEFKHLAGNSHGTDEEYHARLAMVQDFIRKIDPVSVLGINDLFDKTSPTIAAINEARAKIDLMSEFPNPDDLPPEKRAVILISGGESPGVNSYFALLAAILAERGMSLEVIRYGLDNLVKTKEIFDDNRVWINRACALDVIHMPGAAWGSARANIDEKTIPNIINNLKGHCRTIFIIGGNDHTRQASELAVGLDEEAAREARKNDIAVVALPKTIDRDTGVYPVGADTSGLVLREMVERAKAPHGSGRVAVVETMGRDMGYLAASGADIDDPSVFCAVPEWSAPVGKKLADLTEEDRAKAVKLSDLVDAVRARREKYGAATVVVSEGFRIAPDDPILLKVLASDKILEHKYNSIGVDVHGNPLLSELGISRFVAEALELELGLKFKDNLSVDSSGYSYRDISPNELDRKVAEMAVQLAADCVTDPKKRADILTMGGACIAADADIASVADVASTMKVRPFEEGVSLGTISLDSGFKRIFDAKKLASLPILGVRVKAGEKLPDIAPSAAANAPVEEIDFEFALRLIGSQVESARGMKRIDICVIDRPSTNRFFGMLNSVVGSSTEVLEALPPDISFTIGRNASNIIIVKPSERRSFDRLVEDIASIETKKEGATLVISRDYLIRVNDPLLASLAENDEVVRKVLPETKRVVRDGIEYYNFNYNLAEIFSIALAKQYKFKGIRRNFLNRVILKKSSDSRASADTNKGRGYKGDNYKGDPRIQTKYGIDEREGVLEAAERIFTEVIPPDKIASAKILDCAAGRGLIAGNAVRHGASEVVVLDDSAFMLGAAKQIISKIESNSRVRFVEGDMFGLDDLLINPDGSQELFDYITVGYVLCLFEDAARNRFFEVAMRHLKPGGKMVILEGTRYLTENKSVKPNIAIDKSGGIPSPYDYKNVIGPYVDGLLAAGYVGSKIIFHINEYDEDFGLEIGDTRVLLNTNVLVVGEKPAASASAPETELSTDAAMEVINKLNLDLLPPVERGKTLYHVIAKELLPISIRSKFEDMLAERRHKYPNIRERIELAELSELNGMVKILSKNNLVDVAVPNESDLSGLPKRVKGLVFKGDLGGTYGFRQLEGIIAALNALQMKNMDALGDLYEILTGNPFTASPDDILKCIDDPVRLAIILTFNLKPIVAIDLDELERFNKKLIETFA